MPSYDITRVKADVEAALHGTTINQVTNFYGALNRAARDLVADVDPAETKRIVALESPIFNKVYDYVCPTDLKGDRIIDIRPQFNRNITDNVLQTYNKQFDLYKDNIFTGALFTTQWNTGVKSIRISMNLSNNILINGCDSISGNGTWAAFEDANGLKVDQLNFVEGTASLIFSLGIPLLGLENSGNVLMENLDNFELEEGSDAGNLEGYLENSTMTAVDISEMQDKGALFAYVYMPDADSVTSYTLRWGSSSANYWEQEVFANQDSTTFQLGWNLLRFDWQGSTEVGSPDATAVNYLRLTINSTEDSGVYPLRFDSVTARLGSIFEIEYYSKFLFRSAITGAFKETVTTDTDLINLDTDSYQIFFNRTMYLITQQMQGLDSIFADGPFFLQEYEKSLARYKSKYKSEVQPPQSAYYGQPRSGYSRYMGSRWLW